MKKQTIFAVIYLCLVSQVNAADGRHEHIVPSDALRLCLSNPDSKLVLFNGGFNAQYAVPRILEQFVALVIPPVVDVEECATPVHYTRESTILWRLQTGELTLESEIGFSGEEMTVRDYFKQLLLKTKSPPILIDLAFSLEDCPEVDKMIEALPAFSCSGKRDFLEFLYAHMTLAGEEDA